MLASFCVGNFGSKADQRLVSRAECQSCSHACCHAPAPLSRMLSCTCSSSPTLVKPGFGANPAHFHNPYRHKPYRCKGNRMAGKGVASSPL